MRATLLAGSAMLLATLPMAAAAQDTAPEVPGESQSATDDAEADADGGLEEIVVTAQRREENLQRAAIAVSAVSGDSLVQQSITDATDITRLVPSLQITRGSANVQIYLRGVGTFAGNAFAEQGVAFNLDGVYLDRPAAPAGLFYDLERIEVLKGPQGTLYGRNASGGAINVITAKPRLGEFGGFVNAEYGNYDTIKASAAVNVPLGDNVALRVSGQHASHDGYFNDGYDDEDTQAGRIQLKAEAGVFDILVAADYAHIGGKGSGGTITPLLFGGGDDRLGPSDPRVIAEYLSRPPTPPVPQIIATDDGFQDNNIFGISATINADLGFATLTFIPAYRDTDLNFESYASSFLIDVVEKSKQTSAELRLANDGDRLKWVLGAYYLNLDIEAEQFFNQASNGTVIDSSLETESFAVFGQATWSVTDDFRVTGGLRYTTDNKKQLTNAQTLPFVGFVPPGPPDFIPIILNIPTLAVTDVDFDELTWKAGIELDVGPRSLLYASVSTGFKSGILFSAIGRNYSDPETLTAYTVGLKNRFLDNRMQLNLEAFYWSYKDQQISHLGPVQVASTPGGPIFGPVFLTENAGAATIYGAEAELLFQLTPDDLLSANLQYLNATYDELTYQFYSTSGAAPVIGCAVTPTTLTGASPAARIFDVDCSGRPLINSPEVTLNVGYEHTFDFGESGRVILGADTRLEGDRFVSIDYSPEGTQDAFTMTNARITYETASGKYAVTAFVTNIEDEIVFSNSFQSPVKSGVFYNQLRPPRTYGVRASVKF